MCKNNSIELSDSEIVSGFRRRDECITRHYFYGYCRMAYYIYDRHYDLCQKPGLDFFSIAHEYYLALSQADFRPLDDRSKTASLKTWMINGFRFVLLDRLKAYKREHRVASIEERISRKELCFNVPEDTFQQEFRDTVNEICDRYYGHSSRKATILRLMLIDGYKGREVAEQLKMTPSAVSQSYHRMMDDVVIPYFKEYFVMPEMEIASVKGINAALGVPTYIQGKDIDASENHYDLNLDVNFSTSFYMPKDYTKRVTPDLVQSLREGEIFVFGSNLGGYHGGGAARIALEKFGAVWGNGDGPQGRSYAIPTMQGGVSTIRPYVSKFISYAREHGEQTFLVTRIGCGIAGFDDEDIAPLFSAAKDVDNIHLPRSFWRVLGEQV